MNTIDKTLKYEELLMTLDDLTNITKCELPEGYRIVFWNNDNDKLNWCRIHIESGEFCSPKEAEQIFDDFYSSFKNEIPKRCFFIEDRKGNKIATATISPTNEFGYNCVIDWFAISKKAQGLKLSKPLLYNTIKLAKDLGYDKILLHTQTHTWLAANIYLNFGFEPYIVNENTKGWQILHTIVNNEKLSRFNKLNPLEIFDELAINIKNNLDVNYDNYNFSVWHINGRNDVYVFDGKEFYEYKFFDNGKKLELIKKYIDKIYC